MDPVAAAVCAAVGGATGLAIAPVTARDIASRVADGRTGSWAFGWGREAGARLAWPLAALGVVAGALVGARLGLDLVVLVDVVALVLAGAAAIVDVAIGQLPRRLVYAGLLVAGLGLGIFGLVHGDDLAVRDAALGGLGCWAGFGLLHMVSPRSMGMGDVRLAALLGVLLGWSGLRVLVTGLALAFLLGALLGLPVLLRQGRRARFPFGPALVLGAVAGLALVPMLVA